MPNRKFWSLNKALVLLLLGGFAMLLLDIRYEHREVLGKETASWIPVIFSGAMVLVAALGLAAWYSGGRKILAGAFALSLVVGALGVYYHTEGKPSRMLAVFAPGGTGQKTAESAQPAEADNEANEERIADAALRTGEATAETAGEKKEGNPPPLAPLAFFGLGAMGLLATTRRFPAETDRPIS